MSYNPPIIKGNCYRITPKSGQRKKQFIGQVHAIQNGMVGVNLPCGNREVFDAINDRFKEITIDEYVDAINVHHEANNKKVTKATTKKKTTKAKTTKKTSKKSMTGPSRKKAKI